MACDVSVWYVQDLPSQDAVMKISESLDDSIDMIGLLEQIADGGTLDQADTDLARRIITNINVAD